MSKPRPPKPTDRPSAPRHRRRGGSHATEPARRKSLYDITREWLTPQQLAQLVQNERSFDTRVSVLVRSALIDNLLEEAIDLNFVEIGKSRFSEIFRNPAAPLGSLSAKIALAHALGIFGNEMRSQLDKVRAIRNAIAHTMIPISFSDEAVAEECNKLDPARLTNHPYQPEEDTPSERFFVTCNMITAHLVKYVVTMRVQIAAPRGRRQPWSDKFFLRPLPASQT